MTHVQDVNGILLLFDRPLRSDAHAHLAHIAAFAQYSVFPVWAVNVHLGFPPGLAGLRFRVVILHYTLFGGWCWPHGLPSPFLDYLDREARDSYKVAFFQDEYRHCRARFAFLDAHDVDCVYTLLDPADHNKVYGRHTRVRTVITTLTGYVSDDLVALAGTLTLPDTERTIDVGHRARRLDTAMGRAALEKSVIGEEFGRRAPPSLRLDIATEEERRIYGADWWRFLANCRGMLGAESGVSIFDLEDQVWLEYQRLKRLGGIGEPELPQALLEAWEDNIPYRIVSPRHFEAAAFRVCQIMFEGRYSGAFTAGLHYLALRKDFSNFDQVMDAFSDPKVRREVTERAFDDVIVSGRYSHRAFIAGVDAALATAGCAPDPGVARDSAIDKRLAGGRWRRLVRARGRMLRDMEFPGRVTLKRILGR